ncbi:hypothetical protein EI94DRAFT_1714193 [Lactarius quietus]|nr:hypothetical protein EI94DRAFT_1714193 [Lactarius quietus]
MADQHFPAQPRVINSSSVDGTIPMVIGDSSSFLHVPYPRNERVWSVQVPPQTESNHGVLLQDGNQADINHAESYQAHDVNYDYRHWAQYCDNASYQAPPNATENTDGQYAYHRNLNIDCPPLVNDQDNLVPSGPSRRAYYSPPARDIPDGGVRDRAPLLPDLVHSSSQSVPGSPPPGILAMESLRCLADRYLHDPGSRIDTLHMRISPSSGRLRVTIVFDMEV